MNQNDIRIVAEPVTDSTCRFTVDRPLYPEASFYFASAATAQDSPLASRLFAIEGVSGVLISHDQVTVNKAGRDEWPGLARQIGAAIREHVSSNEPAVHDTVRATIPPAEEIREKVQQVLDSDINPAVAAHGGFVQLIDVQDNNVFIQMGGGCQGCGMANVTLKHGVETAIRRSVPEVGAIMDTTDHAAGRNPYFAPSAK